MTNLIFVKPVKEDSYFNSVNIVDGFEQLQFQSHITFIHILHKELIQFSIQNKKLSVREKFLFCVL